MADFAAILPQADRLAPTLWSPRLPTQLDIAMAGKITDDLAAILAEAKVPADFQEWLVTPGVGILDPGSLGLASPKEVDVSVRIVELAKAGGVKTDTLAVQISILKAWHLCR